MPKTTRKPDPSSKGVMFGMLVFALAVTYGFGSWAIDSGSFLHYLLSFVGFYYSVSYLKKFVSAVVSNNEKKPNKSNNKSKASKA